MSRRQLAISETKSASSQSLSASMAGRVPLICATLISRRNGEIGVKMLLNIDVTLMESATVGGIVNMPN